jgi:hypothetical protein
MNFAHFSGGVEAGGGYSAYSVQPLLAPTYSVVHELSMVVSLVSRRGLCRLV